MLSASYRGLLFCDWIFKSKILLRIIRLLIILKYVIYSVGTASFGVREHLNAVNSTGIINAEKNAVSLRQIAEVHGSCDPSFEEAQGVTIKKFSEDMLSHRLFSELHTSYYTYYTIASASYVISKVM